jgi:ribosomal protein L37E
LLKNQCRRCGERAYSVTEKRKRKNGGEYLTRTMRTPLASKAH